VASVELRGLTKRYGSVAVVDAVSLKIEHGLLVCLLGPSGCGKTTTLRLIAGFVEPSEGEIAVGGKVVSSPVRTLPPENRNMSMIFQSYALWPHMTVADNVAYGLTLRKMPRAEIARKVAAILATTRLGPLADRYPGELSGGQQQRVALARALIVEPETLLLDEPLSNLDANLREEMRFEIRRLHEEFRITTVYVTHDQSEAMVTSDRIAVMNQGSIEQVDDPHTLYTKPRTRFVAGFIGRTNFIEGAANGAEIVFDRFRVPKSALENGAALTGKITFSVRPQSMRLSRAPADRGGKGPQVEVKVIERAYLGEYWDYIVMPAEGPADKMDIFLPLQGDAAFWNRRGDENYNIVVRLKRGVSLAQAQADVDVIAAQIDAVVEDIGVDAAKTGMLSSAQIIAAVADRVRHWHLERLVVDPVMVAKSGDRLLREDAVQALIHDLLPLAMVLTPNLPEAEVLLGRPLSTEDEIRQAARDILDLGPRAVVMKGGHRTGDATDILYDGCAFHAFEAERVDTLNTHGTGCTFSAAIAAGLARGDDVVQAVETAKHYVDEAIRRSRPLGTGHGATRVSRGGRRGVHLPVALRFIPVG